VLLQLDICTLKLRVCEQVFFYFGLVSANIKSAPTAPYSADFHFGAGIRQLISSGCQYLIGTVPAELADWDTVIGFLRCCHGTNALSHIAPHRSQCGQVFIEAEEVNFLSKAALIAKIALTVDFY
jgi:hypothetical protein